MVSARDLEEQLESLAEIQSQLESLAAQFDESISNNAPFFKESRDAEEVASNEENRNGIYSTEDIHSEAEEEGSDVVVASQRAEYLGLLQQLTQIQADYQRIKEVHNESIAENDGEETSEDQNARFSLNLSTSAVQAPDKARRVFNASHRQEEPPRNSANHAQQPAVARSSSEGENSPPMPIHPKVSQTQEALIDEGGSAAPASQPPANVSPAAPTATQQALARWHVEKKLQRKIEVLQAKLHEQSSIALAAEATKTRVQDQLDRLKADLERSKTTGKDLRIKLHRAEAAAAKEGSVPASAAQALIKELDDLQTRHDALERKLAAANAGSSGGGHVRHSLHTHPAGSPVSCSATGSGSGNPRPWQQQYTSSPYINGLNSSKASPMCAAASLPASHHREGQSQGYSGVAAELRILDLELERDQAKTQAVRLQQRLDTLLAGMSQGAADAAEKGGGSSSAAVRGRGGVAIAPVARREQELLDTIALLRSALEKTRRGLESGVSSSRYMHAVSKAKEAAARVKQLEHKLSEADEVQRRLEAAQREAADAQVVVSALRGQVRDLKRRASEAAETRTTIVTARIGELERAVQERDVQLAALRHAACDEARALLAEGMTPRMLVQQLMAARKELRVAKERETELHTELDKVWAERSVRTY